MPGLSNGRLNFAINHMAAPQLDLAAFFALAREVRVTQVEIRNDIAGRPILDGTPAAAVKAAAQDAGVTILAINALQRFTEWNGAREREAEALAAYAEACRARAIILVPTNDGSGSAPGVRQENLRLALSGLRSILRRHGVVGLVEPLGFETSALRLKREAVEAIRDLRAEDVFQITHDTFHHYLAGDPEVFPEMTGLMHISGVDDADLAPRALRDAHRGLVGPADQIGNIDQIETLREEGYRGPISFEPFAASLRELPDPAAAIRESMDFVADEIARFGD